MAMTVAERCRKWRETNPEKARESSRKWKETNPEKVREAESTRNPEKRRASNRKYPEKVQARRMAAKARRAGVLVATTCEQCGAAKVEMHHDDYAKPLAVRWLCHRCHMRLHHEEEKE